MTWIGFFLKYNPLLFWLGWIFDFAVDIIQIEKYSTRSDIYMFLLDKANYPDITTYLEKMKGYSKELDLIRSYDI